MPEESTANSNQGQGKPENLAGEVHWIQHATFYSQLALFLIGIVAVIIYYGQLRQMIHATRAAEDAAYDACVSAKIARQTLIEYQSGEMDTHNASSATVAQVAVTTRGESPVLATAVSLSGPVPPNGQSNVFLWDSWKDAVFSLNLTNVGRSSATNVHVKFTVQILPQGTKPSLHASNLPFDEVNFGVLAWLTAQQIRIRFVDQNQKPIGKLSPEQREDLRTGKLYMVAFGHADYSDLFGIAHWQDF